MFRVFGMLLLVFLVSRSQCDRMPPVSEISTSLAIDPVQTPTQRIPFDVRRHGVVYHIKPLANYELRGLVVSYHNSDSFWDIHHRIWRDKLNFRDLGVVWGHNALSGVYRQVKFTSRDFTLFFHIRDDRVWSRFRLDQVSNNHILAADPALERSLSAIGRGDQILIRGVLCEYSHPGGSRSSSLTRQDQGNGACETVFVDAVTVLREANGGWRMLRDMSSLLLKLLIPVLLWQAWVVLRRRPELEPCRPQSSGPPPVPSLEKFA